MTFTTPLSIYKGATSSHRRGRWSQIYLEKETCAFYNLKNVTGTGIITHHPSSSENESKASDEKPEK